MCRLWLHSITRKRFLHKSIMNSNKNNSTFSQFLFSMKERYLKAVAEGKGREWTVVMGNEAGDLDSLASSLAYSWFATSVQKSPTIALIQTPRGDLKLRAENLHAFSVSSMDSSQQDIMCPEDVPSLTPFPSNRFALVDHNHLLSPYSDGNSDVKVVAVIDHHEDEGFYHDTADSRIITVPTGSCSSLVAGFIQKSSQHESLPHELATLLLCSILVDTGGLKAGGKAEQTDRDAAAFLIPHSTIVPSLSAQSLGLEQLVSSIEDIPQIKDLSESLFEQKQSVSHLSTGDLLRRDYKEYAWTCSFAPSGSGIRVGLSTVPRGLKPWLSRDGEQFWMSADKWMDDRQLGVLGILTSFRDEEKLTKHGKGKHKRQVLFIVRENAADGGSAELQKRLWEGLEASEELILEERPITEFAGQAPELPGASSRIAKAYKQGDVSATRKVIAPLVRRIIEGTPDEQA